MALLYVGGYATEPRPPLNAAASRAFYDMLLQIPGMAGLEIPILAGGMLHEDESLLLGALFPDDPQQTDSRQQRQLPRVVITCIPATMVTLGRSPRFGLASADETGRLEALGVARQACDAVARINARAGANVVTAVEIHSAPRRATVASSTVDAFAISLREIALWDWQGAALVVEHCDVGIPSAENASKGFLAIEDEIAAIKVANKHLGSNVAPIGMCINWARSVLEQHDVGDPVRHICLAGSLLRGIMFSGCSGSPAVAEYGAWADTHMPLDIDAEGSLLTAQAVRDCISAAKDHADTILYVGGKITLSPASADPAARAKVNGNLLRVISESIASEWR